MQFQQALRLRVLPLLQVDLELLVGECLGVADLNGDLVFLVDVQQRVVLPLQDQVFRELVNLQA